MDKIYLILFQKKRNNKKAPYNHMINLAYEVLRFTFHDKYGF